jgi:putative ABC transport system permease protein
MGVKNGRIVLMVLLQGAVVGLIGYCLGVGLASGIEEVIAARVKGIPPAMYMAWPIPAASAAAAALIVVGSSLVSLRRVMRLEPAAVFR